jgi:transcriptional regulator with XRE-family HTH domain
MTRFAPDNLRRVREHLGLSQAALANLSGVDQQNLSRYELGIRRPAGDALVAVCRALSHVSAKAGLPPVRPEDMYDGGSHVGA